jgi:hypothetical protein
MIASMLDRHTLKPCKKLPRGAWGVRNSDRTTIYGSNVNMQQNLFFPNDEFHLRQARCRAEEAVGLFWDDSSPLPKTSRHRDHYETITGAETLLLAIVAVHVAEEERQLGIPFSDIDR